MLPCRVVAFSMFRNVTRGCWASFKWCWTARMQGATPGSANTRKHDRSPLNAFTFVFPLAGGPGRAGPSDGGAHLGDGGAPPQHHPKLRPHCARVPRRHPGAGRGVFTAFCGFLLVLLLVAGYSKWYHVMGRNRCQASVVTRYLGCACKLSAMVVSRWQANAMRFARLAQRAAATWHELQPYIFTAQPPIVMLMCTLRVAGLPR